MTVSVRPLAVIRLSPKQTFAKAGTGQLCRLSAGPDCLLLRQLKRRVLLGIRAIDFS